MRRAGHVARIGDRRVAYRILVGRPKETIPLDWPRRSWEDNIKMDLQGVRWGGMGWIDLAEDRDRVRALVNPGMKLLVP